MAKLTKEEFKRHNQALDILSQDRLTFDEKLFVYDNWNESATSINSEAGAFFTPSIFARDFALEIYNNANVIDLCAGIGMLSFYAYHYNECKVTCVELNPTYYEVGKKLLPEANWINESIFNYKELGHFDQSISNPPFGKIKTGVDKDLLKEFNYKGAEFDLITIEIASKISDCGAFILPQQSTPFRYSGQRCFVDTRLQSKGYNPDGLTPPSKVQKFINETGLDYLFNVGIDTSIYLNEWKGVKPLCEVVNFDFKN
jgi:predicted RNA methylase